MQHFQGEYKEMLTSVNFYKKRLGLNLICVHKSVLWFCFQNTFICLGRMKKRHRDCGVSEIISLLFHGLPQKGKRRLSFKNN